MINGYQPGYHATSKAHKTPFYAGLRIHNSLQIPPSPLLVIAGNIRKFVCFRLFIYMTDFRFMADKDRISYFDEVVEY